VHRRPLLHAAALTASLATAGCLGPLTGTVAGDVRATYGFATLHAVDDPLVRGGIGDGADGRYDGELYTEAPDSTPFLPGPDGESRDVVGDVTDADYDREFVLLYEVRMDAARAFRVLPIGAVREPEWTGWRELALPLAVDPEGELPEELRDGDGNGDEDEGERGIVCTSLATYVVDPEDEPLDVRPASATVTLYDDEGDRRGSSIRVTAD
jgi:hypothetical protein